MAQKINRSTEWAKYQKLRLISAFGGKCGLCGYNKCLKALEFHHINPNEKEFHFNQLRLTERLWVKVCEELRKCVMLCANCHREVHDKKTTIPKNITRFDETHADWHAHMDSTTINRCPVCKQMKPKYKKTCSLSCAGKFRCNVDWSKVDLKKCVALGYSCDKIGQMLNVSGTTVRCRLIKLGLYESKRKRI